jgi:hypothetical protein
MDLAGIQTEDKLTARLDLGSKELESLKLGSKALIDRRKEVVSLLADEIIVEIFFGTRDEVFSSKRRFLESSINLYLIANHPW